MAKNSIEQLPEIVKAYLQLNDHEEKPALPIFINAFPVDVDECIVIQNEGQSSRATYLGQTDELSTPLVACMVRANSYVTGMSNASIIRTLLNQKVVIGNISIVPNTNIIPLGRDERRRQVFRIIYKTIVKE
jgi:hypothetical protein